MADEIRKQMDSSELSYSNQILRTMNDFRKEGALCDVTIHVQGGHKFAAHCTVLAASSHYFRRLFAFDSRLRDHFEVHLKWMYPEIMEDLLDYMYTGEIQLGDNAEDILMAASYFFIEGLPDVVIDFLQENMKLFNCFSILSLADEHSFQALKKSCIRFISANFVHAANTLEFLCLENALLKEVISSDDLKVANEMDIFNAVVKWIRYDLENRVLHFKDLFSCVRLLGMPAEVLSGTVASEALVREDVTCLSVVQEALQTVGLARDVIDTSTTEYSKRSPTEYVSAFVMCGGSGSKYFTQNIKNTACYVPSVNEWFNLPDMLQGRSGHSTAVCNGALYSVGHHSVFNPDSSRSVQCYVPGNSGWNSGTTMSTGVCFSAAVSFQGQLYVLGGIVHDHDGKTVSARVSRYNPAVDKWYQVASMSYARQGLCAVVQDGSILAIGGCDPDDNYLRTVERYDPQQDRWTLVDSMVKKRCFASAAAVNSKVLVVGGRENDHDSGILDCCEMYDPSSDKWTLEPGRLNTPRCATGIGAMENDVFVFGGESEDDALDSVERWDAETRRWSIATYMPFSAFRVQTELLCLPKKLIDI